MFLLGQVEEIYKIYNVLDIHILTSLRGVLAQF